MKTKLPCQPAKASFWREEQLNFWLCKKKQCSCFWLCTCSWFDKYAMILRVQLFCSWNKTQQNRRQKWKEVKNSALRTIPLPKLCLEGQNREISKSCPAVLLSNCQLEMCNLFSCKFQIREQGPLLSCSNQSHRKPLAWKKGRPPRTGSQASQAFPALLFSHMLCTSQFTVGWLGF